MRFEELHLSDGWRCNMSASNGEDKLISDAYGSAGVFFNVTHPDVDAIGVPVDVCLIFDADNQPLAILVDAPTKTLFADYTGGDPDMSLIRETVTGQRE